MRDGPQLLPLDGLPPLPQVASLRRVFATLWAEEDVAAVWLGGSFARDTADQYSDVDLRVAVRPGALAGWRDPDLSLIFGGDVVGHTSFPLGENVLHHLALSDGDIYDLWIHSTAQAPSQEAVMVLGCRDDAFAEKLAETGPSPAFLFTPADSAAVQEAVVSFWINSLKHRKVLHRGLDLVAQKGVGMERDVLQRLWYIEASGTDIGAQRPTIHSLAEMDHVVMGAQGLRALALTGAPLTTRGEIIRAIEAHREEVARVGRRLAERLGFAYPEALERTVRQTWQQYQGGAEAGHAWAGKRLGTAAVIRDTEGRVLLVRHGYGMRNWELPGGAAEAGESVAETAVREVREETGLSVVAERLTGIYYAAENDSHHFVFQCQPTQGGQEPRPDHSEITDCGYFPPDVLPRPISDFTVRRLQDALAGAPPPLPVAVGPRQWLE